MADERLLFSRVASSEAMTCDIVTWRLRAICRRLVQKSSSRLTLVL
jgi:hypothetical protein